MASNTHGPAYDGKALTLAALMDIYDKLPKALRVALANADHNWSAEQTMTLYRKHDPRFRTASIGAETITQCDRNKHARDVAAGVPVMPSGGLTHA